MTCPSKATDTRYRRHYYHTRYQFSNEIHTGQAIIQARNSDDVCTDDIFLTDYQNCLQCSGPDNVDIWRYYGGTLTTAASSCGLSTTPLSGEQPDVGPAIPAGGSDDTTTSEEATSSATSAPTTATTATEEAPTTTATSTAEEESSAAPTTTATTATGDATEAPTSTAEEGSPSETQETTATTGYATELPTSTGESVSATSTGYVTSSATDSGYVTLAPSATQGGNGTTATTTVSLYYRVFKIVH